MMMWQRCEGRVSVLHMRSTIYVYIYIYIIIYTHKYNIHITLLNFINEINAQMSIF